MFRDIILGRASFQYDSKWINANLDPFTPKDFWISEHRKMGTVQVVLKDIKFFRHEGQSAPGFGIRGDVLKRGLPATVLNANFLDYLFGHQDLIPDEWKKYSVFFWGTIFCWQQKFFVPCLAWSGTKWVYGYKAVTDVFFFKHPAAFIEI